MATPTTASLTARKAVRRDYAARVISPSTLTTAEVVAFAHLAGGGIAPGGRHATLGGKVYRRAGEDRWTRVG